MDYGKSNNHSQVTEQQFAMSRYTVCGTNSPNVTAYVKTLACVLEMALVLIDKLLPG